MCFARSYEVLHLCHWSCSGHNGFGLNIEKERPVICNWALYPLSWQACQSQYHRSSEHICPAQAKILRSKDHIAKGGAGKRTQTCFIFISHHLILQNQTMRGANQKMDRLNTCSSHSSSQVISLNSQRAHSFTTLTTKNDNSAKWPEWSLKGQGPECGFLKLQAYTPATYF